MRYLVYSMIFVWLPLTCHVAYGSDDRNEGITATGTCLKKVAQDRASVTLLSTALAPMASDASREATKAHQKLRESVQALKLENMSLETTGYNVSEEREWVNKKTVSKGFRANLSLEVQTSDIARIGDVIAVATKLGIKGVSGLNTFVSNEKYKSEYEGCLESATRNAKDKALKLAKGAGVKLGKVLAINEGGSPVSSRSYVSRAVASGMMALDDAVESAEPAPTIDAKPIDMTVSATVTFDAD